MALKYAVNDSDVLTNLKIWCPLNEESDGSGAVTRYDAHNGAAFTDGGTTASAAGVYNRRANFIKANSESIYTSDTNTDITGDFSMSVLVNFTTLTSGQNRCFFGKDGSSSTRSFGVSLYNNAGTHQFVFFISSNGSTMTETRITPSMGNLSTATDYHIVATWDASTSTAEIWVDGVSQGTNTGTENSISNTSAAFYIGRFGNYSGDYTDAKQQDFALWDAVVTDAVVAKLYNSGDYMTYGVDYDTSAGGYNNSLTRPASLTWTHVVTGTNAVLLVEVQSNASGAITGATYNGVAMTLIDSYATGPGIMNETLLYALEAPATGSNTVSVQTGGTGSLTIYGKSASYIGTDQTTPNPHSGKNSGFGTTLTLSIDTSGSPSTDNCWIVSGAFTDGNYSQTAGAGTRRRTGSAAIDNWMSFFDQYLPINPAGSDSLVVNISTSSLINQIGVSLAPVSAAAPAASVGYKNLLTLGAR